VVCPGGNAQPRGRGLYRGRERQITWRTGGGYRGETNNMENGGRIQGGSSNRFKKRPKYNGYR